MKNSTYDRTDPNQTRELLLTADVRVKDVQKVDKGSK